jgi:hypothetical protein
MSEQLGRVAPLLHHLAAEADGAPDVAAVQRDAAKQRRRRQVVFVTVIGGLLALAAALTALALLSP